MYKQALILTALSIFCVLSVVAVYGQVQTSSSVQTNSQTVSPTIVMFYAEGCPNCARMEDILNALLADHPNIKVVRYEINAPGSRELLWKLSSHYKIVATQVPVIFVGDKAIVGAGRAQEFALRAAISDCAIHSCPSPLDYAKGVKGPWNDLLMLGLFVGLFIMFLLLQG